MSAGVEFDEDRWLSNRAAANPNITPGSVNVPGGSYGGSSNVKGFTGWLIRHGLAKSEKSAQIIELVIIAINFIITILVIRSVI